MTYECTDYVFAENSEVSGIMFNLSDYVTSNNDDTFQFYFQGLDNITKGTIYHNNAKANNSEIYDDSFSYERDDDVNYLEEAEYFLVKNETEYYCKGKMFFAGCKENCATCEKDNLCESCTIGFVFVDDDNPQCISERDNLPYYYKENGKFLKCHEHCESCTRGGDDNATNCEKCKTPFNYYTILSTGKHCNTNCQQVGYKGNLDSNGQYECVKSCSSNRYEYENNCINECPNTSPNVLVDKGNLCVQNCEDEGYYSIEGSNNCTKNCKESNKSLLNDMCVSNCNTTSSTRPYSYNNVCLEDCPPLTKVEGNECKFKIEKPTGNEPYVTTNLTKTEITSIEDSIQKISYGVHLYYIL